MALRLAEDPSCCGVEIGGIKSGPVAVVIEGTVPNVHRPLWPLPQTWLHTHFGYVFVARRTVKNGRQEFGKGTQVPRLK